MKFDKTISIKKGKDIYTNNMETTSITLNGQIIVPYCIIGLENRTLTIKEGTMITQTSIDDNPYKQIILMFVQRSEKNCTQNNNNTKKETRKKAD